MIVNKAKRLGLYPTNKKELINKASGRSVELGIIL